MCLLMRVVCTVVMSVARITNAMLRSQGVLFVDVSMLDFALMLDSRDRCNTVRVQMAKRRSQRA